MAVGSSNKGRTETHGEGTLNCREAHSSDTLEHNICTHKISNKLQVKIRCKRRHGRRKSGYMYLRMSLSRPTYLVKANGVPRGSVLCPNVSREPHPGTGASGHRSIASAIG